MQILPKFATAGGLGCDLCLGQKDPSSFSAQLLLLPSFHDSRLSFCLPRAAFFIHSGSKAGTALSSAFPPTWLKLSCLAQSAAPVAILAVQIPQPKSLPHLWRNSCEVSVLVDLLGWAAGSCPSQALREAHSARTRTGVPAPSQSLELSCG